MMRGIVLVAPQEVPTNTLSASPKVARCLVLQMKKTEMEKDGIIFPRLHTSVAARIPAPSLQSGLHLPARALALLTGGSSPHREGLTCLVAQGLPDV